MKLIFDTETNGLPKSFQGAFTDTNNWPRVIQLAYAVYDDDCNLVFEHKNLIKPDGWEVPNEKFWIDHGYSNEQSIREGKPIKDELLQFIEWINKCDTMIAHNLSFDYPILICEMIRAGLKADKKPEKFCTMKYSTNICKLPSRNGFGYKWPKLEELHHFLFEIGFDGAHDALNDVRATARCYFELMRKFPL